MSTEMTTVKRHKIIVAAEAIDWGQIVMNRGPACFRLEKDGRFCGRAQRWDGHTNACAHEFVSLADLLRSFTTNPADQHERKRII